METSSRRRSGFGNSWVVRLSGCPVVGCQSWDRHPTSSIVIWNNHPPPHVEHSAMEKLVRRIRLPGVSDAGAPPPVIIDSRSVVASARRRAIVRDVIDLLLLICVDGLFLRWPLAHVPLLDRHDSLSILVALNALLLGYMWLSRSLPRWMARRVATTWSLAERTRFFRPSSRLSS
jgi:hypothetical protein